jgi:hypothetical protein
MIVIGVDAHKRTHTLVTVDVNGRILGERLVDARPAGHTDAVEWVLLAELASLTRYSPVRVIVSNPVPIAIDLARA